MNSSTRFLERIVSTTLLSPARLAAIERIDTTHIYVENVRAVFGLSERVALWFCELAVRQGILEKRVEVYCPEPEPAVAAEAETIESLPPSVPCWRERDGLLEEVWLATSELRTAQFYVLKEAV